MRTLFIIVTLWGQLSSIAQETGTNFYFKEVNWSICLPNSFSIADSVKSKQLQEKGVKLIEEKNDVKVGSLKTLKDLISATKGKFNYFSATIRSYNFKKEGNYFEASDSVKKITYRSLINLPNVELDSLSTIEIIDKLSFDKFKIDIFINKTKYMTMVILAKLYKGYDFGITYLYTDDKTKEEIEKMLARSKFDK